MANHLYMHDTALQLQDATAITSDDVSKVGGVAKTLDVGPGRLRDGACIDLYVSACVGNDGDETYIIDVQGSNDSFSANVVLARFVVPRLTTGAQQIFFTNAHFGTLYREIRLSIDVGGTTPSITFTAFLTGLVP